jgi:hypothetical protein
MTTASHLNSDWGRLFHVIPTVCHSTVLGTGGTKTSRMGSIPSKDPNVSKPNKCHGGG